MGEALQKKLQTELEKYQQLQKGQNMPRILLRGGSRDGLSGCPLAPSRPHLPMASLPFNACLLGHWSLVPLLHSISLSLLQTSQSLSAPLASWRARRWKETALCFLLRGIPRVPLLTAGGVPKDTEGPQRYPECSSPIAGPFSSIGGGHRVLSLSRYTRSRSLL